MPKTLTPREQSNEFIKAVVEPLRGARDHAHWLAVHRQVRDANSLEALLEAVLRMSYEISGRLARDERLHSCDAELRNRPDFDQNRGTPESYVCSCGKKWECFSDESFGTEWVPA